MKLFLVLGAAALVGCHATDDRPETLAYITEAILTPSCGTANCHSAMVRTYGYAFDSVAAAQESIAENRLIEPCPDVPCPVDKARLIQYLTKVDSLGHRMPLDAPLANADIYLIGMWIVDGADGYVQPVVH